ncbi:MAG TPA: amino acid ABC transporter permease [Microlunatus sp.]|nr:amino acid ABC transporter permease [Microlunatus sp.]
MKSDDTSVLFDAPGPKAVVRHRVMAVAGAAVLVVLALFVLRAMAQKGQLTADMWSPFLDPVSWTAYIIPGLIGTLIAAAISVVLAVVFGILLGMGRLSELKALRIACGAFVEFFRAVPVLMMMLFAYYFGLFVLQISGDALPLFGTVVGLTFYNSCVIAELVRSGVHSLPRGQREAGWALGLTPTQTLTSVLLPQAITAMLPSIISQLVVILKDSALGYNIAYLELLRQGQNLATYRGNLIPTLIVLALVYILINYGLTKVARLVERRLREGKRGIKAGPTAGFVPMEETEADEGVANTATADR